MFNLFIYDINFRSFRFVKLVVVTIFYLKFMVQANTIAEELQTHIWH